MSIKLSILVLILALGIILNWTTISAYLYWPFDRPPEVTFESAIDPEQQKQMLDDFCSYAKREEIRHQSIFNKSKREAACKKN